MRLRVGESAVPAPANSGRKFPPELPIIAAERLYSAGISHDLKLTHLTERIVCALLRSWWVHVRLPPDDSSIPGAAADPGRPRVAADSGLLERDNAGVYRLPNSSKESYEPRTIQLLRLVYEAPDHEMSVRQAESALDWSAKLLSATASELRSRSLVKYEKCELAVPGEIVEKVARGEGVLVAPGKMFYGQAAGPRVDASAFTTLRLERPRVDLAQEIRQLRMLKKRELDPALDEAEPRLGIPRANLEIMVKPPPATAKAAQRRKTQSAAKEQLRVELLRLVGEHPEALPSTKDDHASGTARWSASRRSAG